MPHSYTENHLVEQPAIQLFAELGWQTVSAMEEGIGEGVNLGRETKSEVVLLPRLRSALEKLNPTLPPEAISSAIDELTRDRSAMSQAAANREIWELLKEGIKVSVADRGPSPQPSPRGRGSHTGGQKIERVQVVNWFSPKENDFLLVSQMTITGPLYTCRPDLIGFVSGLPLVVIELKKPGVPARQAFDENLTSYKHLQNGIPALFWYNAFMIASNGTDSRVGSLTADWNRFFEWKRIEREDEPRRVSLDVMIRGTCEPARLIDIIENFTLFSEHKAGLVKVLAQNHQVLGVNNAITAALNARQEGHGRVGVFWQTQGAGKSFSMVFFAQKIMRKVPGNWTFVVITDRTELDDQIARTFKACGAVSETESKVCHAESGAHLRQLLTENHRYVFTLIHKFQTSEVLCDRRDVIVLTDEAHRSQYDTQALNMRTALPNALFLAFTGTPLIAGEERTRAVFGDYVSIYDFQQSVEDGATVPLFYENRTPALHLENPSLNDDIYDLIEAADLSEEGEKRLERELGRQYHLITRDERLEVIAKDIVHHFLGRGFQGKAMVVSIDKVTALRMYDKVRKYWQEEKVIVERELSGSVFSEGHSARLKDLTGTDMALIVSPGQNEIEQMKELGLDIVAHRKRMNDEPLDEKFKDPADPLRLVFVCAMWLTGFDAPSCSTIYLDKPMRNHSLMQAIARANRVFPEKKSGMIVDYANVFASLERALAIYGKGQGGEMPVRDKRELVEELRTAVSSATRFCLDHGVDPAAIETIPVTNFSRAGAVAGAADKLMAPETLRREYLAHESLINGLFKAVKPDPLANEFEARCSCLRAIAEIIRGITEPADISAVMQGIKSLLDESISPEPFRISDKDRSPFGPVDLSLIDFEALRRRFDNKRPTGTELARLKAAVKAQLERMVRLNPTRTDYLIKFQELIESYNSGSRNIEDIFRELLSLSQILTEEQTRHIRENLSDEELTIFDILTRPGPELSTEEREEVKKVARLLLEKLKKLLVLDWRNRSATRAQVRIQIEDLLDDGLPRSYAKDLYQQKCSLIFEHVYENYYGDGKSLYSGAA